MNNQNSTQKERELLTVTPEEARDIVWEGGYGPWTKEQRDDTPGYQAFEMIEKTIEDTSRWSVHYSIVVQRVHDGKYFSSDYSQGATESQDQSPYDQDDPIFTEVFPVTKTITVYE